MSLIKNIKKELRAQNIKGIAIDVDETLSFTLKYWFDRMQNLFGNPENLSTKELIAKYRYAKNVPYWQTKEAIDWMIKQIYSNKVQTELEVIGEADKYLPKLHQQIPVAVYLTVRPEEVNRGTEIWLANHGFPKAPVIARPSNITHADSHAWKAEILSELYPEVAGLVDDNDVILEHLSDSYKGKILLYSRSKCQDTNIKTYCCPTWSDVVDTAKLIF